jgi:HlyD family secretion protein
MNNRSTLARPWVRRGLWAGAAILLVAAAGAFFAWNGNAEKPGYRFAKVSRGDIRSIVSASGSVRPVVTVLVGSQVSGKIAELLADFNSPVKAGEVIGRLDPAIFEAKVWQLEADLEVARANVSMQESSLIAMKADVDGAKSNLVDTEQDYARKKELLDRLAVAQSVLDKAKAVKDQALAKVNNAAAKMRMQESQVEHARASVEKTQAELKQRQLDFSYTIIKSPVDGVVISRNVDVGQTVAASLQAPTLFTIAQDLRKMQVEVSVDEADIGRIKEGQDVTFTVDAFPEREFHGNVTQIRKAPTEVQNVVTYTVIVGADNPDQSLLPGMTANVSMIVGARESVLRVESAALRFRPADAADRERAAREAEGDNRIEQRVARLAKSLKLSEDQQRDIRAVFDDIDKRANAMREQGMEQEEMRRALQAMRENSRQKIEPLLNEEQRAKYRAIVKRREQSTTRRGQLWVLNGSGELAPVNVGIGISDGAMTELVRSELEEGHDVVIGAVKPAAESQNRRLFGF